MKRKMKFILMILVLCCFSFSAFSQSITLNVRNITVKEAIEQLKQNSGYTFVFEAGDLDTGKLISVQANQKSIEEVIEQILKDQNVSYEIRDKNIVVTRGNTARQITTKNITGLVTDVNHEPVIGATVVDLSTNKGTVTGVDGKFTLEVTNQSTLQVSYIGYTTSEVVVGNQQNLTIQLNEDAIMLDEMVVIGYGTVRKSDLTGSVASIKTEELNRSTANLEQSLVGHTPGVQIKQVSGAPGSGTSIRIRGINSVYTSVEPLFVVDGFPASKDVYINPSDVASIEVLKDAASAAIYGSRAAGGVVLITTKRGEKDKTRVELDYQFSIQELSRKIDMMNADELRELHRDGYNNTYFDFLRINNIYGSDEERWTHSREDDNDTRTANGASKLMLLSPDFLATKYDTDWQDALFSKAPMHRTGVSISGGKSGYKYMFSLGYLDQDGIVAPSNHKRITSRLNMDVDVSDRLSVGVNSNMFYVTERTVRTDGLAFNDGLILNTLGMPPQYPVYEEDGSYATGWTYRNFPYSTFAGENPVALKDLIQQYYTRTRYSVNTDARYKFFDGLYAKVNAGLQISDQIYRYYRPAGEIGQSNGFPGSFDLHARASNDRDFNTDWLLETTLNYNKKFGKHTVNGLAGYSMQKKNYDNIDARGQGFKNDRIPDLSAAGPTATDENGTSAVTSRAAWSIMSFFGRVIYSYDSRYVINASLRGDGSSRFGPAKRWGYFPSVSAGWKMSNEEFFASLVDIMTVRLRASWGISGNFNISNYRHIPNMAQGTYNLGQGTVFTYYPSAFVDQKIGWEKTNQTNIGADLGFLKGRLNLIANYYHSVTNDLLYNTSVSAVTGYTGSWTNLAEGKVYNRGFDLQIDGSLIATQNVKWNAGFNISVNRNKVMGLSDEIITKAQRGQITHITRNGLPIGSFYGMVSQGVINAEEYANILIDKANQSTPGYELVGPPVADYDNVYIGDVKWKDVDGNGKITEDDREIIGNNYPDFTFGFNTSFNWKGLSFSATFDGQYGADVINFSRYYIANQEGGVNTMRSGIDRYRDEANPGNGLIYRANRSAKNLNTKFSTYFVEDASFLRCTNITLGYNISKNRFLNKLDISNVYVFGSVDNALMFTDYLGYNPDVDYNSGNLAPGIDFGTYPIARSYSVGVKLSF
ncbi:MAG TPA: TonB-dependent receptor [Bacteroidales bacterium]|nr:TonB-dependent receptor [Bacteroidales bacterium]HOQ57630.1 TonB-dependent receptor [Bacteroidales bacterium]HPL05663.1 TonB-dependent receptor [Bacteroidales bacterium]